MQQSPSRGIDRSTVTPARRSEPKSGSIKQSVQPTNHRSVTSRNLQKNQRTNVSYSNLVESKQKELSTPKVYKYLKESV
ncbi:hypothetical protein NWO25_16250 [Enterococcus lactis]|nr:hypothetical protein [Enterococcus lactis]